MTNSGNSNLIQNGIIDPNKETVLFCAAGGRSALATKTLKEMGYDKLLGTGSASQAYKLTIKSASAKAVEKTEAAGGEIFNE